MPWGKHQENSWHLPSHSFGDDVVTSNFTLTLVEKIVSPSWHCYFSIVDTCFDIKCSSLPFIHLTKIILFSACVGFFPFTNCLGKIVRIVLSWTPCFADLKVLRYDREMTFYVVNFSYLGLYKCTDCFIIQIIHVLVNHSGFFNLRYKFFN